MKSLLENKKGDVPITILVIGVFAVCALAIFSFSYSIVKFGNSFDSLEVMEKVSVVIEENPSGSYHKEIVENEFVWNLSSSFSEEVVVFSVDYFGGG